MNMNYIDYLTDLAKLQLNEIEKESIQKYIDESLRNVQILNEIDIDNNIMTYTSDNKAILRDDKIKKSFNTEKLLKNAGNRESNYFKIG